MIISFCRQRQVQVNDVSNSQGAGGIIKDLDKPEIRIDYVQHTLQVAAVVEVLKPTE
jgi:hypothetical protein